MIPREELENKGLTINGKGEVIYDYSDFETLICNIEVVQNLKGKSYYKVSNFRIVDLMNNATLVKVNYDLYYDKLNEFYIFLRLLGYRLPVNS